MIYFRLRNKKSSFFINNNWFVCQKNSVFRVLKTADEDEQMKSHECVV